MQTARLLPHLANGHFLLSERGADPALDAEFEGLLGFPMQGASVGSSLHRYDTRSTAALVCAARCCYSSPCVDDV